MNLPDVESELLTLNDELEHANQRLSTADREGKHEIIHQIREIKRDIQRYSKRNKSGHWRTIKEDL